MRLISFIFTKIIFYYYKRKSDVDSFSSFSMKGMANVISPENKFMSTQHHVLCRSHGNHPNQTTRTKVNKTNKKKKSEFRRKPN